MADTTTQKQTAATDTAPGHAPAGAERTPTVHKPGGTATSKELDLEALLGNELGAETIEQPDPELDRDLPKGKAKKGNQAPEKPKAKAKAPETEAEEADETDTLNSAVEPESEEEGEEDEAETKGDDDEDTEGLTDEELEAAMPENSADIDPDQPPKGLENVPKPVWKRLKKQSEQLRDLKAQLAEGPVVIAPTRESPLSDVQDIAALDERVSQARADRDWVRKNPEGGTRKVNGKDVEISAEKAAEMLADSDLVIDADATTRTRLMFREQHKPWEAAQAVAPEMFTQGSAEHTFMMGVVQHCPEITQKHPQWEYLLACAAKGMRQVVEERSGKARYVRFEVGPDGKLLPLRAKSNGSGTAKPKPKAPPANPGSARPALTRRADGQKKPVLATTDSDSGLSAMLADELGE